MRITNPSTHPDAYVTPLDVAVYFGIDRETVYKLIRRGVLLAVSLGKRRQLIPIDVVCQIARVPIPAAYARVVHTDAPKAPSLWDLRDADADTRERRGHGRGSTPYRANLSLR